MALRFHPFTILVEPEGGETTVTRRDPVTIAIHGATADAVVAALAGQGWTTRGTGEVHALHFEDGTVTPQVTEAFFHDGPASRYHVRLWNAGAAVLASPHHEATRKGPGGEEHVLDADWADAVAFVSKALVEAGLRRLGAQPLAAQARLQLLEDGDAGRWRGLANVPELVEFAGHDPPPPGPRASHG